jgi:hypothetical protein
MVTTKNFKETKPEEAKALEVEIASSDFFRLIFFGCVNFCQSLTAKLKSSGVFAAQAVVILAEGGR